MKRKLTILCCFLLMLSLAGCGREDPYRVDTVVRIPVDPTEVPVVQTEAPTETEVPTEEATEESTEAVTEAPESTGNQKPSSSGNQKPSGSKETEPPQTQPPETEPPATEPEETVPEETVPEETEVSFDPSEYKPGSLEYAILDEINTFRTEAGVPELTLSTRLSGIAAIRAEEISRVWSHTRPDGRHYTTAMSDYGYGYSTSAENLIYTAGSGDAAVIVAKWMSAENKDSLLSAEFTAAGIGVYRSGGVTYVANLLIG